MSETLKVDLTGYDCVEICGVRFACALFEGIGLAPVGEWMRVMERRDDGVVTVRTVRGNLAKHFDIAAEMQ